MNFALAIWRSTLSGTGVELGIVVDVGVQTVHHVEVRIGEQLLERGVLDFGRDVAGEEGLEVRFGGERLGIRQRRRRRCFSPSPSPAGGSGWGARSLGNRRSAPQRAFTGTTGSSGTASPARTCCLRRDHRSKNPSDIARSPPALLLRRHARRIAEAIHQRPEALAAACAAWARPRSARRRRRASIPPPRAAPAPARPSPAHRASGPPRCSSASPPPAARSAPRRPSASSSMRHSTNQHGRRRGGVEVIALGVVAKQFDLEARVQPALHLVVLLQQAGLAAEARLVGHHAVERPAPGLPMARRARAAARAASRPRPRARGARRHRWGWGAGSCGPTIAQAARGHAAAAIGR